MMWTGRTHSSQFVRNFHDTRSYFLGVATHSFKNYEGETVVPATAHPGLHLHPNVIRDHDCDTPPSCCCPVGA
jgi:hypothetical protein